MLTIVITACLTVNYGIALASTVGNHTGTGFCYREEDGCGPNSDAWDPLCHTGTRQSPIDLPIIPPFGFTHLNLRAYKGSSFRIQNNGHSIQVDFNNQYPSNQILTFPDPLMVHNPLPLIVRRQYKFAAAHFHWGVNDHAIGSEHCVGGICKAMELHIVHYLANYTSMADALASGNENALSVIAVLINVDPLEFVVGPVPNYPPSPLAPIVRNLNSVELANHNTSIWTTVNEALDLEKIIAEALPEVYTYKGSLTTPGCNEQVNWYVLKKPAQATHAELEAFRTLVKDDGNVTLTENHRPLQAINGRKVLNSLVAPP